MKKFINKTTILIAILFFLAGAVLATLIGNRAETVSTGDSGLRGENRVVTSLQYTYSLAKALTVGTGIEVVNLFPSRISMTRQESFLKKHEKEKLSLVTGADAVISIRYAWPGDPIYPFARKHNIRVLEIDATQPFDPLQSGVALQRKPMAKEDGGGVSPYIWLSLSNALKSADLIASDLQRLFPESAIRIAENLTALKRKLFKLKAEYESRLSELDSFEVVALTDLFVYFTENLNIEVIDYLLKPEIHWQDIDLETLEKILVENEIKGVIHTWQPDDGIMEVIRKAGARLIILNPIDQIPGKKAQPEPEDYANLMRKNLEALYQGLKEDN